MSGTMPYPWGLKERQPNLQMETNEKEQVACIGNPVSIGAYP